MIKIYLNENLRPISNIISSIYQYSTLTMLVLIDDSVTVAAAPTFNWATPGNIQLEQRITERDINSDEDGYYAYTATIYPFMTSGVPSNQDFGKAMVSFQIGTTLTPIVKIPVDRTILPNITEMPPSDYEFLLASIPGIPRWNDLSEQLTRRQVNPATLKPDYDATNIGLLFPENDETEFVDFIFQMPHSWVEGSTIYPHVHVLQAQGTQACFQLQYKWYNVGQENPSSWTVYDMDTYAITTTFNNPRHNIITGAAGISGTGKTISSILKIRLWRDSAAKDTYSGDILADQFDIHIQIDGFGSETEFNKE